VVKVRIGILQLPLCHRPKGPFASPSSVTLSHFPFVPSLVLKWLRYFVPSLLAAFSPLAVLREARFFRPLNLPTGRYRWIAPWEKEAGWSAFPHSRSRILRSSLALFLHVNTVPRQPDDSGCLSLYVFMRIRRDFFFLQTASIFL